IMNPSRRDLLTKWLRRGARTGQLHLIVTSNAAGTAHPVYSGPQEDVWECVSGVVRHTVERVYSIRYDEPEVAPRGIEISRRQLVGFGLAAGAGIVAAHYMPLATVVQSEGIATESGRLALAQAMVEPIRPYRAVGRMLLIADELPQGALPRYE